MRRTLPILAPLAVLAATAAVAWHAAALPLPIYLLRYGLSPGCEPTGETVTLEGVEFVEIGPGVFRMGSEFLAKPGDLVGRVATPIGLVWGERPERSDEMPLRWVEFRRGFWIGRTEVTNARYERFDPKHERSDCAKGDDDPVEDVIWLEARRYSMWLAQSSGRGIRLPSESEWECACRAGSDDEFTFGDDEERLDEYAWFDGNSGVRAHAVAAKRANRRGLFDMHGNLWEWCADTYRSSHEGVPADGSPWTEGGLVWKPGMPFRVFRGGSLVDPAVLCRSANRSWPHSRFLPPCIGFRPAFTSNARK